MATADVSCVDEDHRSEKIVYKRRSSIFHTRIIACDQTKDGNEGTSHGNVLPSSKGNEECIAQSDTVFNLKEYIEKLRQERKDWQQEYKNRKAQRRNLTKQKTSVDEQGQVLDINILSESDRLFLLSCPDYEHICQNSQKIMDVALKISALSSHIHKLNQKFMERMENDLSKTTRSIIKLSE